MFRFFKTPPTSIAAFTLVEMLVSMAILVIIAGLIFVNFGTFNSAVVLRSLAFEVAVSIREAQVLAVSVLGTGATTTGVTTRSQFAGRYGVYFHNYTETTINPNEYIIFFDDGAIDYAYDTNDTVFDIVEINQNYRIAGFCYDDSYGPVGQPQGYCSVYSNAKDPSTGPIEILFERPDFNARIDIGNDGLCGSACDTHESDTPELKILLQAVSDATITRAITVTQTGQISVQ